MPLSEKKKITNAKYHKENFDFIGLRVPKGDKEKMVEHAKDRNESLNGFINRAITETLRRDNREHEDDAN